MKFSLKELKEIILQEAKEEQLNNLALKTDTGEGEINLYLYEISSLKVVGQVDLHKTDEPCIPKTYQVSAISVETDYQGTGVGFLLYKMAMFIVNRKDSGLTSDHTISTQPKAAEFWKRLESEGSIAIKRSTGKETDGKPHDTFDYEGDLTPDDPNDDCEEPAKKPATNHSWELTKQVYDETEKIHNQLKKNHFIFLTSYEYQQFVEQLPPQLNRSFNGYLRLMSGRLFAREYRKSAGLYESRIRQIINEELQVVLTNEEAAEMFGEDILEILDEEENNPWAICTASVGRKDKDKYEKCVMSVKKQNKER